MRTRMLSTTMPLTGLVLLMAISVSATGGPGACRADLQKFCLGTQPGRSRRQCLQEHAAELSPGCRERLSRAKAKATSWSAACHNDVQKLCSAVDAAGGNVARCLRQHRDDLSPACRDQLGTRRQRSHNPAAP